MSHNLENDEGTMTAGKAFATILALVILGASIWVIVSLSLTLIEAKKELKKPPAVIECKPREFTGNVKISEHDMKVKGWEGQLWKTSDGTPLGLAVRKIEIEVGPRLKFQSMTHTEWGWCCSWSPHSPGGYCLIKSYDLRGNGVELFKMYSDPKIYDTLP